MNYDIEIANSLEKKIQEKRLQKVAVVYLLKKQFQKIAEPIKIDDKWYEEDEEGNVVEVDAPVSENVEPKSYTADKYGVTFTEGEEYVNWYGVYKVLKINGDKTIDVEYLQAFRDPVSAGQIKTYPILSQAETIYKARRSKEIEMRLNNIANLEGTETAFAMGLIVANGYLSAEVGPKYHQSFPEKYKAVTGEDISKYIGKGFRLSPNEDRWSYTLRVHLPSLPVELLNRLNLPNIKVRSEGIEINDNAFVWGLFNKGFSIGRNDHKAERVASKLTDNSEKDAFWSGVNSFQQLRNIA